MKMEIQRLVFLLAVAGVASIRNVKRRSNGNDSSVDVVIDDAAPSAFEDEEEENLDVEPLLEGEEMDSLVDDAISGARRRRDRRRRSRRRGDPDRRRSGGGGGGCDAGGTNNRRRCVPSDFRRRSTSPYYSDFKSADGWNVLQDCGHCTNNGGKSCVEYTPDAVEYTEKGAVITTARREGNRRRISKCPKAKQLSANMRWGDPSFYGTTTLRAKFFPQSSNNDEDGNGVCYIDSMGWSGAHQNSPSCWMNVHSCKDDDWNCRSTINSACYNCRGDNKGCKGNNRLNYIPFKNKDGGRGDLREENTFQLIFHENDVRIKINGREVRRYKVDNLPHEPMSPRVHCRSQNEGKLKHNLTVELYEWKWEPQSSYDLNMSEEIA